MPPSMGAGGLAQQGRSTEQSVDLRVTYGQLSRTGARRLEQILVDETVDQVDEGSLATAADSAGRRRGPSTKVVFYGRAGRRGRLSSRACTGWSTSRQMHKGASQANRLSPPAGVRIAVFYGCSAGQPPCCTVGTPSTCCVGRSPFCSGGTAPLRNAGSSSTSSSGSSSGSSSSSGGSRSMWLYKVKRPPGSPPVFKVRYVARGFNQCEGVDFFQTFAPTPKTLRVLRHIAALRDYDLHSLDFFAAFLQGSLLEQIWLRRLVYSLRQAPSEWHNTLCTTLAALDFFPSSADTSLFVRRGSTPFFVLVYVDDMVFATPNRHALASVKEELQRRHTCSDLGELQCYLGLQITRDRAARTITLTQSHMVKPILTRFRFPFSKV
ncbi:unnamed protein product [Closterium sp. NIES-54]